MSLFGLNYPDDPGFKKGVTRTSGRTSALTAKGLKDSGKALHMWEIVLAWYKAGHNGTPDECAIALRYPITSIRPRCTQLLAQKKLRETGRTRRTASGHDAYVLEAV